MFQVAATDTHWIAMGFDEDLTVATRLTINQTIAFLAERFGFPQGEAYRLISLEIDLRITHRVDQKVDVCAMIPVESFK